MEPEQMRTRSAEKVKQVLGLMKALHLRYEIKEHVTNDGFIEKTLFWIDEERYPEPPPVVTPEESVKSDEVSEPQHDNEKTAEPSAQAE